jgi:hypothetical protein
VTHACHYRIEARTRYELGHELGRAFHDALHGALEEERRDPLWGTRRRNAQLAARKSARAFPHLVEELRGYADGAGAEFDDLFALSLEEEPLETGPARCTTAITNGGSLVAHNEDWDADAMDSICVVEKTLPGLTILELFYLNTLGGNSISINSHGFVQTINTMTHADRRPGIPRNVVARWLSETRSPDADYERLAGLRRSAGYCHTLLDVRGKIWSIECTAARQTLTRPGSPFVHTNHYLTELGRRARAPEDHATRARFDFAAAHIGDRMSVEEIVAALGDTSQGPQSSVFNRGTIARAVADLESGKLYVWLRRESEKGWLDYDLGFWGK